MKNQNRINNKDLKAAGGNWGHPRPDVKKRTEIPDRPEVPKHFSSKKYKPKKEKKAYHRCPFCEKELPIVVDSATTKKLFTKYYVVNGRIIGSLFSTRTMWGGLIAQKCRSCGSRKVTKACPCCKRDTWYNKKTEEYKHETRWSFCGFTGKKLKR